MHFWLDVQAARPAKELIMFAAAVVEFLQAGFCGETQGDLPKARVKEVLAFIFQHCPQIEHILGHKRGSLMTAGRNHLVGGGSSLVRAPLHQCRRCDGLSAPWVFKGVTDNPVEMNAKALGRRRSP
jgi:hypothetical protein